METIVTYLIIGLVVLIILFWIPITKEVIRPVLSGIGNIIVWLFMESYSWVLFFVKSIAFAHRDLLLHLMKSREDILPEEKIKKFEQDSIKD